MPDQIVLDGMVFQARHGVHDHEKVTAQRFEVDVELLLDLQPAGLEDDLARTLDYGRVYETVRAIVESTTFNLIETLAEAIAHELLADFAGPRRGRGEGPQAGGQARRTARVRGRRDPAPPLAVGPCSQGRRGRC